MTPEKQRIEIAKACGLTQLDFTPGFPATAFNGESAIFIPDYVNDLNACHEAEKMLIGPANWGDYYRKLAQVHGAWSEEHAIFSTAAQRAEALLRHLKLWT